MKTTTTNQKVRVILFLLEWLDQNILHEVQYYCPLDTHQEHTVFVNQSKKLLPLELRLTRSLRNRKMEMYTDTFIMDARKPETRIANADTYEKKT